VLTKTIKEFYVNINTNPASVKNDLLVYGGQMLRFVTNPPCLYTKTAPVRERAAPRATDGTHAAVHTVNDERDTVSKQ